MTLMNYLLQKERWISAKQFPHIQVAPVISRHLTHLAAGIGSALTLAICILVVRWHRDVVSNRNDTIYIHACINPSLHTYIHINTHIYCSNFETLSLGNAYKPTKEPRNCHAPCGDWTDNVQTEAASPSASCPARSFHTTETIPKR